MTPKKKKKELLKYILFVLTFVIVLVLVVGIIRFIDKIDENNSGKDAVVYISTTPSDEENELEGRAVATAPDEQPINFSGHNLV